MQALMTFEPSCTRLVPAEANTFRTDLLQEFTKSVTAWNGWKCDFQKNTREKKTANKKEHNKSQAWQISHKQAVSRVNFKCKQVMVAFS